jgi:single-strand DNA-binding protein
MQMLDSKGDNQNANDYKPQQAQNQQQQGYQQPSYQQQQPQSYQQPSTQQQAYSQSKQMPSSNAIPEIDIDEDEIPF